MREEVTGNLFEKRSICQTLFTVLYGVFKVICKKKETPKSEE